MHLLLIINAQDLHLEGDGMTGQRVVEIDRDRHPSYRPDNARQLAAIGLIEQDDGADFWLHIGAKFGTVEMVDIVGIGETKGLFRRQSKTLALPFAQAQQTLLEGGVRLPSPIRRRAGLPCSAVLSATEPSSSLMEKWNSTLLLAVICWLMPVPFSHHGNRPAQSWRPR